MSNEKPIARESHYVPRAYMNRWSPANDAKVWCYRTLVPRLDYPMWRLTSTRGVAVRRDLYTSPEKERDSDRVERWLSEEVDTPGHAAVERVLSAGRVAQEDRQPLVRYAASLACRTPRALQAHVAAVAQHAEAELNEAMSRVIPDLEERIRSGKPIEPVPQDFVPARWVDVKLSPDPSDDDPDRGAVDVGFVIGRDIWTSSIEHIVTDVSKLMENHDWRLVRPHPGWRWFTSDEPLLRVRRRPDGSHDFEGRWGDVGTVLMLPLSPDYLLFAEVGKRTAVEPVLSLDQTYAIQRLIAEHAHRWVIAQSTPRRVEWFRPRLVDLDAYNREEQSWGTFHETQTAALYPLTDECA